MDSREDSGSEEEKFFINTASKKEAVESDESAE